MQIWHHFEKSVRTGGNPLTLAFGGNLFHYFETHPEDRAIFDKGMSRYISQSVHELMATSVPLDGISTIVDIGGGQGRLAQRLVERAPHLKAICFDHPAVIAGSPFKDDTRIKLVAGDFFKAEEIPTGADAALLATVLHILSDEQCVTVLKNVRAVLPTGGKLFVSDHVVSSTANPSLILDLDMYLFTGGKERTEVEFAELGEKTGFKIVKIYPVEKKMSFLSGVDVVEFVAV
eukprot:TRINITY_DN151_c0_g1_i1.p1 TRINITY_DN151_c0_g1~~TRINITY_DN151_c0_g1_i1.p1  ORF type:complete len:233 (-),score=49.34 TRINITY_DN151_c0_g1_i1:91-789(-)